jgi:hypothetical protein
LLLVVVTDRYDSNFGNVELKRFPPDLNQGDSQMVIKGGLFAH